MKRNSGRCGADKRHWFIVALLLCLTLACNLPGMGTSDPTATFTVVVAPSATPRELASPTPYPTYTPRPTYTPPPDLSTGSGFSLEIINASDRNVAYVYISPSDADSWGEDWLGDDVIPAGEVYVIDGLASGIYDMEARDIDNEIIATVWETEIATNFTWRIGEETELTAPSTVLFSLINYAPDTIAELYISPSDSDTWGAELLEGVTLEQGESYDIRIEPDTYDMQVRDSEGELVERLYSWGVMGDAVWEVQGAMPLPGNAVLRFEDDFSDNRNSWGETETDEARYNAPSGGEYCIDIKTDNMTAWEWYEPFRPDEFVAEVYCSLDPTTDASCGLGFGPDGDNLYWFEISPDGQAYALFLLLDDEWQESLVPWTYGNYHIDPSGGNYLSIQRVDGILSLFVNGVLMEEVAGAHFPTGRIGLGGSTYDDANVTVCLDNLRVWRLE